MVSAVSYFMHGQEGVVQPSFGRLLLLVSLGFLADSRCDFWG